VTGAARDADASSRCPTDETLVAATGSEGPAADRQPGPRRVRRYHRQVTEILEFPATLLAHGAADAGFRPAIRVAELPPGALIRVTFGDLDLLLAHTTRGLVAIDDRCPHMSAPLSIGELDGCVIGCPLHSGRFDLATGDPVQMPTTGGLWPDGRYEPVWTAPGREDKPDPPGKKADARRLTRVRRIRYYPVRIVDGVVEVAVPG
jgi:3-phenylpropionate/trans-cinnamate dioxygenase ferredoxin component